MSLDAATNGMQSPETSTEQGSSSVSVRALSQRSLLRSLTGIEVVGTGGYVPANVVTNEQLGELGYDSDWIIQRTGIQARRQLSQGEATSDMAFAAAEACLRDTEVDLGDIDLVVVATMTPDHKLPSTACLLQQRLGLRAAAMDLNAACAGFMYALTTAAQFIKTGCSRYALVVGADSNTQLVNPADEKTFPLFGDGAGAVLLGAGQPSQGFRSYTLGAEGSGADLLMVPAGGSREPLGANELAAGRQFLQMDGRSVFKWAVRLLSDTISDVLLHGQASWDDIRVVILHQANLRIVEAAAEDLGIDRDKLVVNLDRYGNTSAASIPLALDEAHRTGQLKRGDQLLLCGFGAGLAWGTALLRW